MRKLWSVSAGDVGDGLAVFAWSPCGRLLAVAGSKRHLHMYERDGKLLQALPLEVLPDGITGGLKPSSVRELQWHPGGALLAVLLAGSSCVHVWDAVERKIVPLESDFKAQESTALAWAPGQPLLAIGTAKGNLQLHDVSERRRVPLLGKHTKRIAAAAWGSDRTLALASLDKTLSLSNTSGDTLRTLVFRGEPLELLTACGEGGGGAQGAVFSLLTAKRVLYVLPTGWGMQTPQAQHHAELALPEQHGTPVRHSWLDCSRIVVAFRSGLIAVVAARWCDGRENALSLVQTLQELELLADVAACPASGRVAVGGGDAAKLLDARSGLGPLPGEAVTLPPGHVLERLGWGQSGQVLTMCSSSGLVATYLTALPAVFSTYGTRVARLTCIGEVTVTDAATRASVPLQVECEPVLCALGPSHVAVGINNQLTFYSCATKPGAAAAVLVQRRTYVGTVMHVQLNERVAAVLLDGRVLVHAIEPAHSSDVPDQALPLGAAGSSPQRSLQVADPITVVGVSTSFIITGSSSGVLRHHALQQGRLVALTEHRDGGGAITCAVPQPRGTRLVYCGAAHGAALLNPVSNDVLLLPSFPGSLTQLLWDVEDEHVFAAVSSAGTLLTYVLTLQSVSGQSLEQVCAVTLDRDHTPLVLSGGRLTLRLPSGALDTWTLDSHKTLYEPGTSAKQLQRKLAAAVRLRRMDDARAAAGGLNSTDGWHALGLAAMELLDVRLAAAAFRQAGDAAMSLSLAPLEGVEDRCLLAGSLMVLLERDYDCAQELLLRSSQPLAALEMRLDLKHWQQALELAVRLAPESVPSLSKEHAAALEMVGEHAAAREHYQQALDALSAQQEPEPQLLLACRGGLARTALHLGDVHGGKQLAVQTGVPGLLQECGAILEGVGRLLDAAELYERSGQAEKAASILIAAKHFAAAQPLMAKVGSAALQLQYAKAKEGEGRWLDAAEAYEAAGDTDAAVRLSIERLGDLDRAVAAARRGRSAGAAAALARHCLAAGDVPLALEFLLMAGQQDQAHDVAAARGEMDCLERLIAATAKTPEDAARAAERYERRGEAHRAADMWARAGEAQRALRLYVQVGSPGALEAAVALLESSCTADAAPHVLDALAACDALDPGARDALRLRANLVSGRLSDAAHNALALARRDQDEGNYKSARAKLLAAAQQLRRLGAPVPVELSAALALLHSYVLAKSLVALGDHVGAARMLARVAGSISRFPKHIVPILTSTVIECQRAGLRATALQYATVLMLPEHRPHVSDRYRRGIEQLVRKPDRGDDPPGRLTPCPSCGLRGAESELTCVGCQAIIPFDLASGMRMTLQDWCECPRCRMPCSGAGMRAVLAAEGRCPLCGEDVDARDVAQLTAPLAPSSGAPDGGSAGDGSTAAAALVAGALGQLPHRLPDAPAGAAAQA